VYKIVLKFIVLIGITTAFLAQSCAEEKKFTKDISQGIIEYEVTYPDLDSNDIMLEMLPDKMVMTFKNDKFKSNMSAGAGLIEMGIMTDATTRTMYNLVKIFGDRYVLELSGDDVKQMTDVLPPFQLKNLDEEMVIAEAACEKVLLDFGISKSESYIFFYTRDIKLKDPNWYTPYNEIEGVLLDYRIENYNMHMRLKATKIIAQEIDDSEFVIDDSYETLTKEEFDKIVVQNMTAFME
jgi:hypothetical protein